MRCVLFLASLLLAASAAYSVGRWLMCRSVYVLSNFFSNRYSSYSFSLILTKLGTHDLCALPIHKILSNGFAKFWFLNFWHFFLNSNFGLQRSQQASSYLDNTKSWWLLLYCAIGFRPGIFSRSCLRGHPFLCCLNSYRIFCLATVSVHSLLV